nr:hypothetical protein [uncultured Roseateles sp.]
MRVVRLLANGMGGLDWSGLPLIVAHVGVTDLQGLLDRVEVILQHRPPESAGDGDKTE